jgi:hypothetical protein
MTCTQVEVRFYAELAPQLVRLCPSIFAFLPGFYAGSYAEGGREFLILEDLAAAGFRAPHKTHTLG